MHADDLIAELLRRDAEQERKIGAAGESGFANVDSLYDLCGNLFDLALDLLGVPKDNSADAPYSDLEFEFTINSGFFCRDWLSDQWMEIMDGQSGMTILEYIAWVRSEVAEVRHEQQQAEVKQ